MSIYTGSYDPFERYPLSAFAVALCAIAALLAGVVCFRIHEWLRAIALGVAAAYFALGARHVYRWGLRS